MQCSVVETGRLRRFWTQGFRHCGLSSRSTEWHKLPARLCGCTKWKRLQEKAVDFEPFLANREDLATVLSTADLAIIPSRSEGFGVTALETLSAGWPFLVTQASGFGEALQDVLPQSTLGCIDSEESHKWAEAIKSVREAAIAECQIIRESYG